MPNIDDLKNDGNATPFVPSLEQGGTTEPFIPSIEGGETPEPPRRKGSVKGGNNVLSMTSGKVKDQPRQKVDISELPQEKEIPGVDIKESMEKEILGPGGPFEEYLDTMTKEATEFFANEELEQEISGEETDAFETETPISDEEDLENIYSTEDDSFANIDVFEDDNAVEEKTKVVEETPVVDFVEDIEHVVEEPVEEKEDLEIKREVVPVEYDGPDDDLGDDDDEIESNESDEEDDAKIDILRSMISERLKPVSKRLDISGFTIASKPSLSSNIVAPKQVPIAKWALPSSGVCIHIKEILGSNLEKIRTFIQDQNIRGAFQIIYDNIVSEKPGSLEAWMKSIAFEDYDHIFFAIYIAAFKESNFVPITCTEESCKESFITENLPMSDMVKFDNEESENKFKTLLRSDVTNSKGLVPSEIVPISDRFAFGFILPSLYNILIESTYLDKEFSAKYSNAVAIAPYIDKIYAIDQESKTLIPIGYKEFANNKAKTVKSRVVRYDKVLSTLSTDEIATIRAYISKIVKDNAAGVSYQIPAITCPKCGKEIAASPIEAASLVFTRNQLGLLMNI